MGRKACPYQHLFRSVAAQKRLRESLSSTSISPAREMVTQQRVFVNATIDDLILMRRFVEEAAAAMAVDREVAGDMVLAMNEAANNIIRHGYRGQPGDIDLEVNRNQSTFSVILRDQARRYDPTSRPEPDTNLALEQRQLGGMGIHLMREFTDKLRYRLTETGQNELELVKFIED
jgi:anti-sigma regulatory factor (Ser/Thr protein kinase)